MVLVLRKKTVNKKDYYSLWDQENNNSERIMNIGTLEALKIKLVKAEKLDRLTKKYDGIVTNILEEPKKEND